jgi:hypothetical protein
VEVSREARASGPLAVFALQGEESGTPALGGHARALCRDDVRRRMDKIAQHLPADGGVRIEQPVQDVHAAECNGWCIEYIETEWVYGGPGIVLKDE